MEFPELPLGGNYEPDTFKLYFADSFEPEMIQTVEFEPVLKDLQKCFF